MKRICAVLLFVCLLLTACTADRTAEREFFAMDTLMHVKIWGSDAADAVRQELFRLEKLLSVTENSSDVALLNCGGYKRISDETDELLHSALAISERTGGAFDPTVYPLVRLWGFTEATQRVPSQDELQAALSHIGIENVDAQDGFAELKNGAQLQDWRFSDGTYRVFSEDGEFLLLGRVENSLLTTIKSFFEVKPLAK